jgi:raffinose/stachyose/melibiose transport system substrate-binding protein
MKRVFLITLMVLLSGAMALATGQGEGGDVEPVTIRFNQHGQDYLRVLNEIVPAYEETNENVTVEVVRLGGDDYWAALRTVLASGDVHDLFAVQAGAMLYDFIDAGHLEPIDDLTVLEDYADTILDTARYEGQLWGMPPATNAMGVVYNMDIAEELGLTVPRTVSEMEAVVEQVKDAGYLPFAGYYNDVWTLRHLFSLVHTPLVGDPVAFANEMKSGERDTFAVDGIDRALDMVDLMNANVQDRPFDAGFGDACALLAQGEAAMIIQGIWAVGNITSIDTDFNAGIFAVPVSENPEDATLSVDVSAVWSVYSGGEHVQETKDFLNWLMAPDQMQILGDEAGSLMAFNGFTAGGELANINAAVQEYLGSNATHRWGFNKWATGFDMEVVAPAMQTYLRDGDREELLDTIDSQYPDE